MFLYMLNENEGKAFMELAVLAMKVNGEEKECEKAELEVYLTELGLTDPGYKVKGIGFDDAVSAFKHSSIPVKRCVILEICGILYADKEIDPDELAWVNKLADTLNVCRAETERLIRWSKDFSDFIEVGLMYINAK